ncbi:MAG: isochorismatase family protein [Dehalococcoidales bacterium]|nr:isochorismatase family protein [Dehalococcoidales bacterium]
MRKWEAVFSDADRELRQKTHFGRKQPFGTRPALIIIDVNNAFVGSQPKPVLESVEEYRTSCGEAGWAAIEYIKRLLLACRAKKVPVIFTTGDPITAQFSWGATKATKSPRLDKSSLEGQEIADEIKPLPSEFIVKKTKASAFHGTSLLTVLHNLKADCLLVAGTTTSGCVRASVVDAFSYGFPCFVVEEGTFDRFELSHLVNLWDMDAKYADVITLDEALEHIAKLSQKTS